jgi:hypothetical protein
MNRIAQEEPIYMKKKMSRALVPVLVSVLVLTTAALAATGNLFELFGTRDPRYAHVAGQATLAATDDPGALPIRFGSAYYDGLSLAAVITADAPPEVTEYTPSAEELAAMQTLPLDADALALEPLAPAEDPAWQALKAAIQAGTPYGYRAVRYDPVAFVTNEQGIEIPLSTGDEIFDEQGRWITIREFELPLPEALRGLPAITLRNEILRMEWAWYFDGKTLYRQSGAGESAGFITATVPLAEGSLQRMRGRELLSNGMHINASADVTAMAAVVTLSVAAERTVGELLPADQQPPAGTDAGDIWVEVTAWDEAGRAFRAVEGLGIDQPLPLTIPLMGTGALPEQLMVQIKLQWEGQGNDSTGAVIRMVLDPLQADAPAYAIDNPLPTQSPLHFDSMYYDGLSLSAAFAAANPPEVTDYAPSAEELAAMHAMEPGDLDFREMSPAEAPAHQALQAAMRAGTPYGYRVVDYAPGDVLTTANSIDIPAYTTDTTWDAQGRSVQMREFETPLPESLRMLDTILLRCEVFRTEWRVYFDGETLHAHSHWERQGVIHAGVARRPDALRGMRGDGMVNDTVVSATADVTAMVAVVTLSADAGLTVADLLPADQQPPAGTEADDIWVEVTARDEAGRAYRGIEGLAADQPLPVTIPLLGVGELPGRLTLSIKLQWEGEGNDGAGFVVGME